MPKTAQISKSQKSNVVNYSPMKTKLANPKALTKAQSAELQLTGMVIVGDRIIRTAAFIQRTKENADKEIPNKARRLFA